jgi:hypothetical protein
MTEYELNDVLTTTGHAALETFSVYVSLMVAYLVATYLAGQKLSTTQITTVSILYVVTASILIWATYSYVSRAMWVSNTLEAMNPNINYGAQPATRNILTIVMSFGVLACLRFMWDVRHSKGV